jgi:hypothetical protein
MIENNSKTNDQRHLMQCEICHTPVRQNRMERHMEKVHNISSVFPVTSIEQQPSIVRTKPSYNTVWPWTEKTGYTIVHPPKSSQQMNRTQNVSNKIALLAPVTESYLETAVRDIYPKYKKVSFGSNMKKGEMVNIQKYVELHRNINVYLFYQNSVRYKAILTDEFYIFSSTRIHPKPWGSWNDDFSSYYTVTNIKPFEIPVTNFTYSSTKNKIEFSPHKPSWVFDIR